MDMAINIFRYNKNDTIIHKLSPLVKFIYLLTATIMLSLFSWEVSVFVTLFTLYLYFIAQIKFRSLLKLLFFALLILIIPLIIKTYSLLFDESYNYITLINFLQYSLNFYLLLCLSNLFISTTSLFDLRLTLEALIKPIPKVNEKIISLMVGLSVYFVAILFRMFNEYLEVLQSRNFPLKSKPLKAIYLSAKYLLIFIPFWSTNFLESLISRNYLEAPSNAKLDIHLIDYLSMLPFIAIIALIFFL